MKLANSFIDSNKQILRVSVNMADVGSIRLASSLADVKKRANELFDTAHYHIEFTGTTVTFLEGSAFIIAGLKQSIVWAFLLIAACMLYLFRSFRILICSLLAQCDSSGHYCWCDGLGGRTVKTLYRTSL